MFTAFRSEWRDPDISATYEFLSIAFFSCLMELNNNFSLV